MSTELFNLHGRIALVTGSSQGLGLAMVRGLAEAGAHVVLNGRDTSKLDSAVTALGVEGIAAHGVPFDITDSDAVKHSITHIEDAIGPVDILVNNAGIQRRGPIETFGEALWRELIETNLTGSFLVTRQVVKGMIARQRGKIINICSVMSEVGRPTIAPYTASKGAMKMFTRALAAELGKFNIQVNGIGPGYFATELNAPLIEDAQFNAWICARTPAGRWGDPAELVGTAVFLASRASDFVNGQIIYVDGGILASL
jgi:gluconate 5-dehydrogenase